MPEDDAWTVPVAKGILRGEIPDSITRDGQLAEWHPCKGCGRKVPLVSGGLTQTADGHLCIFCQGLPYWKMTPLERLLRRGMLEAEIRHLDLVHKAQRASAKQAESEP